MTTIALWICVCADDWAAELAVKASNVYELTNGTFIKRVTLKAVKYDADDEVLLLRALWANVFDILKYYMMFFYNWWLNIVVRMQTKK